MSLKNFVAALLKRLRDELSNRELIINQQNGFSLLHIARGSLRSRVFSTARYLPNPVEERDSMVRQWWDWTFTHSIVAGQRSAQVYAEGHPNEKFSRHIDD